MVHGDRYITIIVYLHTTPAYPSLWNGDCYITIIVYLHTTPAYPSLWNSTCYVMITVDRGLTSTITRCGVTLHGIPGHPRQSPPPPSTQLPWVVVNLLWERTLTALFPKHKLYSFTALTDTIPVELKKSLMS